LNKDAGGGGSPFAIDTNGNLYVATGGAGCPGSKYQGCIAIFSPGALKPSKTILLPVGYTVDALAFDRAGNLYVSNDGPGGGTIAVYAPATGKLVRTITAGIAAPLCIAFDRSGNLYVGNGNQYFPRNKPDTITIYPPGSSKPARTIVISRTWGLPVHLAIDRAANLYVAANPLSNALPGAVLLFAPGATTPKLAISRKPQAYHAGPIALDSAGRLYVAYFFGSVGFVTIYAPASARQLLQIGAGGHIPIAIALDSVNRIYIGWNFARVNVYAPMSSAAIRSIARGIDPELSGIEIGPN
ncbi:MAG TPA: hypothetical protein VKR05_07205, partial [Candidatus Cybelea sp.]|nr:hypothetical protein [Candidatus Cybelea sp.]